MSEDRVPESRFSLRVWSDTMVWAHHKRTRGLSYVASFLHCGERWLHRGKLLRCCDPEASISSLEIRCGEELLCSGEPLRCGKQTIIDQQLSLHLISYITLLDFPSNPTKHKKMGD